MELLLASSNQGKLGEIRQMLMPLGISLVDQSSLNIIDAEETGSTFHDNALIKAHHGAKLSGLPTLADDSGLCIDALNGAPGIFTSMFMKEHGGQAGVFAHLEQALQGQSKDAHCMTVLALVTPTGEEHLFEGRMDLTLTFPARGTHGFGYDPIMVPDGETRTLGEMTREEKQALSHRGRALRQFLDFMQKHHG
ncbi:MAG: RdgB/HAM1 family non-canonical purine NTP pyrophosphatase [Holosporales bacterium]